MQLSAYSTIFMHWFFIQHLNSLFNLHLITLTYIIFSPPHIFSPLKINHHARRSKKCLCQFARFWKHLNSFLNVQPKIIHEFSTTNRFFSTIANLTTLMCQNFKLLSQHGNNYIWILNRDVSHMSISEAYYKNWSS